jgi:integrase
MLGHRPLSKIGPTDLQLLYADHLAAGSSPTSVRHLHRFLHRVFDQAVRWGATSRNPVTLVDPPRVVRHEFRALTPTEARRLLQGLRGDRAAALYVLALTTGMRQGELLALRWADLDLPARRLAVRGSLHRNPAGAGRSESRRQIALVARSSSHRWGSPRSRGSGFDRTRNG